MITIKLTPEPEAAFQEHARRRGISSERLALEELNRLFLGTSPESVESAWEKVVHRYQSLVEKEFTAGLTAEEAEESERLGAEIDAAEASTWMTITVRTMN